MKYNEEHIEKLRPFSEQEAMRAQLEDCQAARKGMGASWNVKTARYRNEFERIFKSDLTED